MADFEDRIASWRRELSSAMEDRPDVVDELEDHLRQEFETLTRAGKSPGEAWDAAVARLGDPRRLAREFTKSARSGWLPTRVAMASCSWGARWRWARSWWSRCRGGRFGPLLAAPRLRHHHRIRRHVRLRVHAAAAVVAHVDRHASARGRRTRSAAPARAGSPSPSASRFVGIVLGAIWLRAYRGHYWQWDAREVGGRVHARMERRRPRLPLRGPGSQMRGMVAGVVGNAVVAAAWFGPVLMDPLARQPCRCGTRPCSPRS